jgi:hypothetical protein
MPVPQAIPVGHQRVGINRCSDYFASKLHPFAHRCDKLTQRNQLQPSQIPKSPSLYLLWPNPIELTTKLVLAANLSPNDIFSHAT